MNTSSEKRLRQLHPALASAVRGVAGDLAARGIQIEVVQGLRTYAEQDALYASGRTTPGPIVTQARGGESNHNFGLAADLCPFTGGTPDWNAPIGTWTAIGGAAQARGLEWGGQWKKFLDKPHVQLPGLSVAECARAYESGGLDAVWALASEQLATVGGSPSAPARGSMSRQEAPVTEKRVTVILYGSDRQLWQGGPLQIRVDEIFAPGGPERRYEGRTDASTVELNLHLPFDAGQVYGITFSAPRHRPGWQFIRRLDFIRAQEQIEGDDLILRLMLVPDSPGTTDVPKGIGRIEEIASPFAAPGTGLDADGFNALAVAAKMAFLNIESKLRETIVDGATIMSFVRGVRHVAVDRVFLFFDTALKAKMPRAVDFAGAEGHGSPEDFPDLPGHPDSWKHTKFAEGNVQLSFSKDAVPMPGGGQSLVHSADVDIDLGRGLAHAAEWLDNNVFRRGHKTDQTIVYGLLYTQGILPKYTLDPLPATTRSATPRMRAMPPAVREGRSAPKRKTARTRPARPGSTPRSSSRRPVKRRPRVRSKKR